MPHNQPAISRAEMNDGRPAIAGPIAALRRFLASVCSVSSRSEVVIRPSVLVRIREEEIRLYWPPIRIFDLTVHAGEFEISVHKIENYVTY